MHCATGVFPAIRTTSFSAVPRTSALTYRNCPVAVSDLDTLVLYGTLERNYALCCIQFHPSGKDTVARFFVLYTDSSTSGSSHLSRAVAVQQPAWLISCEYAQRCLL